jgi:transposase
MEVPLELIGNLYFIEKVCREKELSNDEVKVVRNEQSKPILDKLHSILLTEQPKYLPGSNMAKAINYSLNRWDKLNVYLQDGKIPIDNNRGENTIRPYVIGRKNWLFAGGPRGADASASYYSVSETAKANGHEPYWYVRYVLELLPFIKTNEELDTLLPWVVKPETVKAYFANKDDS